MARTDTEQLVVNLEARVRDFERGMQKAAGTADRQFGKMNRSAKASTATLESTMKQAASRVNGALGKIGLGGIAGLGVAGVISGFGEVAKSVADIGRAAKQAGMDSRSFQELSYVAKANRMEVDSLAAGMRELSLRGSEFFTTGSGSAAEAFKQLGYSATEVYEKLKQPSAFLTEIIGKVQTLDKASQIRIFDELFGGDGERFVRLIDQGADGIRATIDEAHRLDAVLSDNVIAQAAELDRQFNIVATTVGTALKRAIVESATQLQRFIDSFRAFEDQQTGSLKTRWSELQTRRGQLGKQAGTTEDKMLSFIGKDAATELAAIDAEMATLAAELKKRAMPQLRAELLDSQASNAPITTGSTKKDGARDKAAAAAEREADAVKRLIEELQHELSLIGMTDEKRRAAEISRQAGTAATADQRAELIRLNEALYQHQAAMDAAEEASENWNTSLSAGFDMVGDALGDIIDGSVKAEDAIKKLIVQLAIAAAQGALLGSGPLAGLFGSGSSFNPTPGGFAQMLGIPGYANGTSNHPGGLAIVGERGPELLNLPKGSQVFPSVPPAAPAGGGGQSVVVNFAPQIDARGASLEAVARLDQQMQRMKQEMPALVIKTVREMPNKNIRR